MDFFSKMGIGVVFISELVFSPFWNDRITSVWFNRRGNHINDHSYLKKQADQIISIIKKLALKPLCLGKTLTGNPLHPAPMVVNRFFGGVNNVVLEIY